MFTNHPFMNAFLLNAGHMVYRPLSPVGDDRAEGSGSGRDLAWIVRGRLPSPIKDIGDGDLVGPRLLP